MTIVSSHQPLALAFGLMGNLISFLVFLAPMPTFCRVYKKKSTEGFQCFPYQVALLSATLWLYYAFIKKDANLLITINSFGCVTESIYIMIYLLYAPKKDKIFTAKLVLGLNLGAFSLILLLTFLLAKGAKRVQIMGWICGSFTISVFAAPLSIMRQVIHTRSVEFMPFSLSFFLTLNAVMWFFYGLLLKDLFVALPNVLGFIFGLLQMILYVIYKGSKKIVSAEELPQQISSIVGLGAKGKWEVSDIPEVPHSSQQDSAV